MFSSEVKARRVARRARENFATAPLLFGRSLLRESFLESVDDELGEVWFVDMFRRPVEPGTTLKRFVDCLGDHGIKVATANHAFGSDALTFCSLALNRAGGDPQAAIQELETGVTLAGLTGSCSFSHDNHNGRSGFGPTTLTRWSRGRLEEVEFADG